MSDYVKAAQALNIPQRSQTILPAYRPQGDSRQARTYAAGIGRAHEIIRKGIFGTKPHARISRAHDIFPKRHSEHLF